MTNVGVADAKAPTRGVTWLSTAVLVIALPLLLVPLNVRLVVHNFALYEAQFERYRIELVTGFSKSELLGATRALFAYFDGDFEPFSYRLRNGQEIYNEREVAHLRDVKSLLRLSERIGIAAGLAMATTLVVQYASSSRRFETIGRSLVLGAAGTMGLLALLALVSLADFSGAFLQFHQLFFSNDLWQLDPRTDNLIRMFPEGFFFDATLLVAMATAMEALMVLGLGVTLLLLARRDRISR
jgi:integral membrane protein (TIGR01906 family)